MEQAVNNAGRFVEALKRFSRRLLTMSENRLELLMVEVQEERERLLQSILLALGVAAFGLLAGISLTGAIVVLLWKFSPAATLLGLSLLYGAAALFLYRKLTSLLHNWKSLSATLDQIRKDRECLEKNLT
jgi:uncharacterized membrane protein YqjE